MPSTITVTLSGDSAPLAAALADAGTGFESMAATADAATVDIGASMDALAASMVDLQASIDALAASFDSMAASAGTASATVDEEAASTKVATAETFGLGTAVDTLTGSFDALMGSVMPVIETLGTLIAVMGAMVIIQDVSSWIENLVQQMFQLDQQTQRVVNSWQYLFSQAPGGGVKAAQALASWAYQESPKLPFTAVDLRGGISTLGTIPGIGPGEIEKFMPVLADIASTLGASDFGGQGITLQQAAQAIVGAQFGLTRQLRYELHINPQELLKFGLKGKATATGLRITDPSTLIPAIEAWSAARGLGGAAQEQETTTFWGALSSFQDYMQNFLQTAGGISPDTGRVTPGSFFGGLQSVLIGVNDFLGGPQGTAGTGAISTHALKGHLGAHSAQLAGLNQQAKDTKVSLLDVSHVLGDLFGGIVTSGKSIFEGLFKGLGAGGETMVLGIFNAIKDFGTWLTSSSTQKDIEGIGKAIGQFVLPMFKDAQAALPDLGHAFANLNAAWQQLTHSVNSSQSGQMKNIFGDLIEIAAGLLSLAAAVLTVAGAINGFIQGAAKDLREWGAGLGKFFGGLANDFKTWGGDLIHMLIQGIQSALPALGAAISNVAKSIASKLHFSKPEEGPLADADKWMPDMMLMFEQGIERGLPGISRAAQQAAAAIAFPMHAGVHMATGGGGANTSYNNSTNYGGGTSMFNLYGATGVMVEEIVMKLLQQNDRTANMKMQAPGGMYLFGMH